MGQRQTNCIAPAFIIGSDMSLVDKMHMSVSEQVTCDTDRILLPVRRGQHS